MLLRIIDTSIPDQDEYCLKVIYTDTNNTFECEIEDFKFSYNDRSKQALNDFYLKYPADEEPEENYAVNFINSTLRLGESLGDKLLDDDNQIYKITKAISDQGYHNLEVQIESENTHFLKESWELLILIDSKFILSTVCKSFKRLLTSNSNTKGHQDIHYQLNCDSALSDQINSLTSGNSKKEKEFTPLQLLQLVHLPSVKGNSSFYNFSLASELQKFEGSIQSHILVFHSIDELPSIIESIRSREYHIVHISASLCTNEAEENTFLDAKSLFECLVKIETGNIILDSHFGLSKLYPKKETDLAELSTIASHYGITNLIGLTNNTDAYIRKEIFLTLYSNICKGFELGQAAVESRKSLQNISFTQHYFSTPRPIIYWRLLEHYSCQKVFFFKQEQSPSDPNTAVLENKMKSQMFGFNVQLISNRFPMINDYNLLSLIEKLDNNDQIVNVIGKSGMGKTHLIHHIAYHYQMIHADNLSFYFDFNSFDYTPETIIEMTAPLLQIEVKSQEEYISLIKDKHIFFAFENLKTSTPQENLFSFLDKILSLGHKVICSGEILSSEVNILNFEIPELSHKEQLFLISHTLQQHQLKKKEIDEKWSTLIPLLQGNPFLIRNMLKKLKDQSLDELIDVLNEKFNSSPTEDFYTWQWNQIPLCWQRFIRLCKQHEGLLLEIPLLSLSQPNKSKWSKDLIQTLELPTDGNFFSEAIQIYKYRDFLNTLNFGHNLNDQHKLFISTTKDEYDDVSKLEKCFSNIICEGLKLICSRIVQQPNEQLSFYLVSNRRHWVKHFEKLWFDKDYTEFLALKNAFKILLTQSKLDHEISQWSLDLLSRSARPDFTKQELNSEILAWLELAISALEAKGSTGTELLTQSITLCHQWFSQFSSPKKGEILHYIKLAQFLEAYYAQTERWVDCIEVVSATYSTFKQFQSWVHVISSLKSLRNYHYQIDDTRKAISYEDKILNDIPYEGSPPGFENQQIMDVMLDNLARKNPERTATLLNDFKKRPNISSFQETIQWIEGDISFQSEDFEKATHIYMAILEKAIQLEQVQQKEGVEKILFSIQDKVGESTYEKYKQTYTSKNKPKPNPSLKS